MTIAVFPECPDVGYSYQDEQIVHTLRTDGPYESVRRVLSPLALRMYTLLFSLKTADRLVIDEFFQGLDYESSVFFLKDPKDFARTGVVLTLVSGLTYSLPTTLTDEDYRHYPIDDSNVQVYDGGTPVSHASVDTEGRTITLSGAPGGAVTADFHAYRLCRLTAPFGWTQGAQSWFRASLSIEETLRESGL